MAGLHVCRNALCSGDLAARGRPMGRAHFRAWLPSLSPALDGALFLLIGGWWWAAQGSAQLAGQCEGGSRQIMWWL